MTDIKTDGQAASQGAADLTVAVMQAYFREKLNDGQLVVTDLFKFPRGISRETWFITYTGADGVECRQVVRRNLPTTIGGICVSSLRQEFEIYHRVSQSAVPIARAFWYEEDPRWRCGGGEFYIRELIDGHFDIPDFFNPAPEFDELKIAISKEHLRKLALVHTCDWRGLGLGDLFEVPVDVRDCARVSIDNIVRDLEKVKVEPIPLIHEVTEWLQDRAPVAPCISFLKGTNGYGEEVFRGREIVALSDWELASIGDPTYDFAHLQDFIPTLVRDGQQIWGLSQALDFYESCSGIHIDPEAVAYYGVMRAFGMMVYGSSGAYAMAQNPNLQARFAWNATEVVHMGKLVVASAIGLLPPLDPQRLDAMR